MFDLITEVSKRKFVSQAAKGEAKLSGTEKKSVTVTSPKQEEQHKED